MAKGKQSKIDIAKLRFLWDFVLVEAIRDESTTSGIIKPEQYDEKPEFGVVISTGTGKVLDDGTVLPMPVKKGDTVLFGKYSTESIRSGGRDYFFVRAEDIRAIA